MPKTYDKRIKSTATSGDKGQNPVTTEYYDSSDNLVRVEDAFGDVVWGQTISGSNFAQNWPSYTYTVVRGQWAMTTTVS